MPTVSALKDVISFTGEKGLGLTVVLPYLPQDALEKAEEILEFLDGMNLYPEISISDWGMLHFIPERFPGRFPLVLGRILAKQKTGPRIELIREARPEAYQSAKRSHVDIPPFLRFLKERGVVRIDLDIPLQGLDIQFPDEPEFSISLFYPYAYISTTRRCPVMLSGKCDCGGSTFILSSKGMPVPLYTRGNTVFFRHEKFPEIPENIKYDRLVRELDVP